MRLIPDATKTELVAGLITQGEAIEAIHVDKVGSQWVVVAKLGYPDDWSEPIAVCDLEDYASAVAHAIAGSVDCDLILAGDETNEKATILSSPKEGS